MMARIAFLANAFAIYSFSGFLLEDLEQLRLRHVIWIYKTNKAIPPALFTVENIFCSSLLL